MTRKLTDALARALASSRQQNTWNSHTLEQWKNDVRHVAAMLAVYNGKFNKVRFMELCDADGEEN